MENIIFKKNGFTGKDIEEVVEIHIQEINKGFLSSLGKKPLELIYSHVSKSKLCILVLAINSEKGGVCGFIFGTLDTGSLYKEFLRQKPFQSLIYIFPKILSFSRLRKAFETLKYPQKKEFFNIPKAELLVFAVKKNYRGSGLARELFNKLAESFKERGIKEFKIATGDELIPAQKFYEKIGAEKVNTLEIHKGHQSLVYIYKIPC
jgi:ribosomal protein S18 acetylase RimI-like enzyme